MRIIENSASDTAKIEGELSRENIAEFQSHMRAINSDASRAITLDLSALDIEDGIALATMINALRELNARAAKLTVQGAPQMLGHNLYRIGLLDGPRAIELIDMREDEPAGF